MHCPHAVSWPLPAHLNLQVVCALSLRFWIILSFEKHHNMQVPSRQRLYYYNTRTGESVWDKPDVLKTVQVCANDWILNIQVSDLPCHSLHASM
jgi:WW domain